MRNEGSWRVDGGVVWLAWAQFREGVEEGEKRGRKASGWAGEERREKRKEAKEKEKRGVGLGQVVFEHDHPFGVSFFSCSFLLNSSLTSLI